MPKSAPHDDASHAAVPPRHEAATRRRAEADADAGFDAFYMATRRRLLLQALAISGNLSTARHAVREAFIAARHHWHKVGPSLDPEAWVRQRVCASAARHVSRSARLEAKATPAQAEVLGALRELPGGDRSAVVLAHLGRLGDLEIGRQLAQRPTAVTRRLANANHHLVGRLHCSPEELRSRLESLAPLVTSPGLPRVSAVCRRGARRRRAHILGGTALALIMTVGAGWFVSTQAPAVSDAVRRAQTHPVSAAMMLTAADVTGLGTGWSTEPANASSAAPVCQPRRAADPRPLQTFVRGLRGPGDRTAVQTVEVSASAQAAANAYATALHWYAGCAQPGVRLLQAYRLQGVGDQSVVLEMSAPHAARYLVSVTGSGLVTSTVVLSTGQNHDPANVMATLTSRTFARLCTASAVGSCRTSASTMSPFLPPSGEAPRLLATVDMPVLAGIDYAWVGTDPVRGGPNLAATTCDHSTLSRPGRVATSRTFLIPQAKLPTRFGLTEVVADFGTPKAARAFMSGIGNRMKTCEKRQPGSSVKHTFARSNEATSYTGWWLSNEINAKRSTVSFWMGVVRVGSRIAQVGFAPAGRADITPATFAALLTRAGQRLAEPPGSSLR